MNPSNKSTYDKINKYRQKIKQNIISQQNGIPINAQLKQQKSYKDIDNYPKMTSSLSRSNIRKNPSQIKIVDYEQHVTFQQPPKIIIQTRTQQQPRSQQLIKTQQNSKTQERSRAYEQSKPYQQSKQYQQSRVQPAHKNTDYMKISDVRTTQKPSTSKSPAKTTAYIMETQTMTKRKTSTKQNDRITQRTGNNNCYQKTPNFHNLSTFETFSQKPQINSVLPPLFPSNLSHHTADHQVKILLEQNQILSMHLNEKMQRIKSLERELKTAVKSQILHEQKYDIELSQLTSHNEMIKKSTDEQVRTLVMQVKKLNDELLQKQQEWQDRVNLIRKTNLQQQQQVKKKQMMNQQKHKIEVQQLRIKISSMSKQFETLRQQYLSTIQKLKQQNISLTQSIQKYTHKNKIQRSQLSIQHDYQIKLIKDEFYRKIQVMNLDKIRKQNQLNNTIEVLSKQMKKLNNQLQDMKHESDFSIVKDMQNKCRMCLQMRQQKQKIERLKKQQNTKIQKLSSTQYITMKQSYQTQLQQLQMVINNLQKLLSTRSVQLSSVYKQIGEIRRSYQQQLNEKDVMINNLRQKILQINRVNVQQQQLLKIKLSQLTQCNNQTIKQIYENKIGQLTHLLIDKQVLIKQLRQKLTQCMKTNLLNKQYHIKQCKQYSIQIQLLKQQLKGNVLKQKHNNISNDKQNIILKQNIIKQSQSYQKTNIIKDQTINKLQIIISNKDNQIEELQSKIQIMKKSYKQQLSLLKQQFTLTTQQKQDLIQQLKQSLQYLKKQQSKKIQQFSIDKQYYSNQLKQVKNKNQQDFIQWVEKLSSDLSSIKIENQDLKLKLHKTNQQYHEYKQLWNQQQSITKLLQKQQQFITRMNQTLLIKNKKLIQQYERDIQMNYKPRILNMSQLINEKQYQIIDMKNNYHQLQQKFEQFMQDKQRLNQLNQKILSLGKNNSHLVQNYITLGK